MYIHFNKGGIDIHLHQLTSVGRNDERMEVGDRKTVAGVPVMASRETNQFKILVAMSQWKVFQHF